MTCSKSSPFRYLMMFCIVMRPMRSGKLDRVGIDLAFLDRLFTVQLTVEGDDLDLRGLACLLQGGVSTKCRRIIDGKKFP